MLGWLCLKRASSKLLYNGRDACPAILLAQRKPKPPRDTPFQGWALRCAAESEAAQELSSSTHCWSRNKAVGATSLACLFPPGLAGGSCLLRQHLCAHCAMTGPDAFPWYSSRLQLDWPPHCCPFVRLGQSRAFHSWGVFFGVSWSQTDACETVGNSERYPIRRHGFLWGRPGRSRKELRRLEVANAVFQSAVLILVAIHVSGGAICLEHPAEPATPSKLSRCTCLSWTAQKATVGRVDTCAAPSADKRCWNTARQHQDFQDKSLPSSLDAALAAWLVRRIWRVHSSQGAWPDVAAGELCYLECLRTQSLGSRHRLSSQVCS